jgi:nitroreductase
MELKEVIGRRRSIRFIHPDKPVEHEKIQKMLEAARLASFWGNVQALKAVVIERSSAPREVIEALPVGTALGGFQFRAAPVIIAWFLDWDAVRVQGDRLHELVDAGAAGVDAAKSHAYLDQTLIPFFQMGNEKIRTTGITEMDCGQGIAQATLVAFEEGLGTCLLGVMNDRKLRRVLHLPADSKILVLQTVGYPKEDPEAGGQRPRRPFEQRFFLNRFGEPFRRDERVVHALEQAKMLQRPAPLPGRRDELRKLAKDYGLPEIFGDEVPAIIEEMTQAAQEADAESARK